MIEIHYSCKFLKAFDGRWLWEFLNSFHFVGFRYCSLAGDTVTDKINLCDAELAFLFFDH